MECRDIIRRLPAYLDGELPPPTRVLVWTHLAICTLCRQEEKRLSDSWKRLGSLPMVEPSHDFKARFWARVRQESEVSFWERWFGLLPGLTPLVAGLAVWVLGVVSGVLLFGHRNPPSPTSAAVGIFSSRYPNHSVTNVYLQGPKVFEGGSL